MAPRRVQVNKFDYKKLTANDVICPICRSILIRPITLPCTHGFCATCFETTTQNENLVCPLCRVRVGSWLRTATKSKKLVNETFWKAIQDLFPLQVRNKLNGRDGSVTETKTANNKKTETAIKHGGNLMSNMKKEGTLINNKLRNNKKNDKLNVTCGNSVTSTPSATLTKPSLVNTMAKNNNQTTVNSEKKPMNVFLNNFASKEYTCRILCQNSKEAQKRTPNESLTLIQKKNKRIQKITESELLNDRSNSIESECLYFKPIDYRHNPPSEGLAPIKVPTRKPNVNANAKILAPCGQNQINMNYLESAFARLFSLSLPEEKSSKNKSDTVQESSSSDSTSVSVKRKYEKSESKSRKRTKSNHKPNESQSLDVNKKGTGDELPNICDSRGSYGVENINISINNSSSIKKSANIKHLPNKLFSEEDVKRSLQEKADFELATKLQQTYNQTTKYSTRSAVLKRMAATKQIKIEGIMTPFEVN